MIKKTSYKYYDIIDGQQRLTTLALLIQIINDKKEQPPLELDFCNRNNYVEQSDFINKYLKRFDTHVFIDKLLKYLTFNILVLAPETSLDLAFTFFSNQNSKGCPLTDFDLLKAHHLRYVFDDEQAKHLSKNWDKMLLAGQQESILNERSYIRTLAIYIFRLRKWLGFDDFDENEKYCLKKEFEAAKLMEGIPPFGEQFQYKEPIQGGPHFFAYVATFIEKFEYFKTTKQYQELHKLDNSITVTRLRDVIEAFLFAYYLKFGNRYLTEALTLIAIKVSFIRYNNDRLLMETILREAKKTKIAHYIDIATSPSFFLAELYNNRRLYIEKHKTEENALKPCQSSYCNTLKEMLKALNDTYELDSLRIESALKEE